MSHPYVGKVLSDRRVAQRLMRLVQLRMELQEKLDSKVEKWAGTFNLATRREVRELQRHLRKVERELKRAQGK